jgi:hypothetical protein
MDVIYPIYEGDDVLKQFYARPYFVGFQARFYYRHDDYQRSIMLHTDPIDPSLHSAGGSVWQGGGMPYWTPDKDLHDFIIKTCVQGERYIFTVCNTHHQQFINPRILALNFGCKERKLYCSWRYDQCYPGNPFYIPKNGKFNVYDDDGAPIG